MKNKRNATDVIACGCLLVNKKEGRKCSQLFTANTNIREKWDEKW